MKFTYRRTKAHFESLFQDPFCSPLIVGQRTFRALHRITKGPSNQAPRARQKNVWPWILLTACTGTIGILLYLIVREFDKTKQQEDKSLEETSEKV